VGTGFRDKEGRTGEVGHDPEMDPLVELGGVINVISSMLDSEIESESISISLSSSSIIAGWTGLDAESFLS